MADMNKVVSIIIPVYQSEKYIYRCLSSVIKQTYKALQIIVIDDASTDNSFEICCKLAKKDNRINVYNHQKNCGVSVTRNEGLEYASGKYVLFLDSDDWIDKDTVFAAVSLFEKCDSELTIFGYFCVGHKGIKRCISQFEGTVEKDVFVEKCFWELYDNQILSNIGTKLYKRDIIEAYHIRFDPKIIIYEDIRFFLEYVGQIQRISLSKNGYYYYDMTNTASLTHIYQKNFWRDTLAYCKLLCQYGFDRQSLQYKKSIVICLYRAYLQECHNPRLSKKRLWRKIENDAYPFIKNLKLSKCEVRRFSIDQRIFIYLICRECLFVLWLIAKCVSKKG